MLKFDMRSVLLFIVGTVISFSAVAQKKTPTKHKSSNSVAVPAELKTAFQAKYSDAGKQKWSKKASGNYVATFLGSDNVKQEVEFDSKGTYIKSKSIYSKDQVPEIVATSLAKNYADAEVLEVMKYDITGVSPYYKVKITSGTKGKYLLVSEAGDVSE
jgi:hypothetical protein